MKLYFPEITFQAAHYIPGHPKCKVIHGHTYFVRNLEIEVDELGLNEQGISVDFGVIKGYFKENWDHKFIVPKDEMTGHAWLGKFSENLVELRFTSAEWMAIIIRKELGEKIGWDEPTAAFKIHFELWEGPNQAVIV